MYPGTRNCLFFPLVFFNGIYISVEDGGAFMNIYSSLKQRCKGASLADPLYLIYDDCGNFLKIIE